MPMAMSMETPHLSVVPIGSIFTPIFAPNSYPRIVDPVQNFNPGVKGSRSNPKVSRCLKELSKMKKE